MSQRDFATTVTARWERVKTWIHQQTRPAGEVGQAEVLTDAEVIAGWIPVSQISHGHWRFNPLLDLPLQPYAGMDKAKLWEMFVYRLAESEAQNILRLEQAWTTSPERSTIEPLEAPLRPSDLAAAVIVWLWRNGLRHQAIGALERIWRATQHWQKCSPRECIPWPAESALDGLRIAAHRDWDDADQAEFATLFRQRYVDKEIERGIKDLTR